MQIVIPLVIGADPPIGACLKAEFIVPAFAGEMVTYGLSAEFFPVKLAAELREEC